MGQETCESLKRFFQFALKGQWFMKGFSLILCQWMICQCMPFSLELVASANWPLCQWFKAFVKWHLPRWWASNWSECDTSGTVQPQTYMCALDKSMLSTSFTCTWWWYLGSYPWLVSATCHSRHLAEDDGISFVHEHRLGNYALSLYAELHCKDLSHRVWPYNRQWTVSQERQTCDEFYIAKQGSIPEEFITFFPWDITNVATCFIAINAGDINARKSTKCGFVHFAPLVVDGDEEAK